MPLISIKLDCPIHDSFRVRQVAGMFDLPVDAFHTESFTAEIPDLSESWDIGVIVGPSGSGKTTIARAAFGDAIYQAAPWPEDRAAIDCFGDLPIKQIIRTLTSVGFSSPPSWLKPYGVLSNGEKFRCELARALLDVGAHCRVPDGPRANQGTQQCAPTIFDEFTSVVDRTVARIGSAAIAKAIRTGAIQRRFVAVTCHYDVIRWLQPDWVLDMSGPSLKRGRVRSPPIPIRIERTDRSLWRLFKRHHYLSASLHPSATCFVGSFEGRPAAFTAVLPFPHPVRPGWREHRTVCLPDYQGVGIGTAMSEFVARLFVATGKPYFSTTSHPAMIRHRAGSELWRMHRKPGMVSRSGPASRRTTAMADTISRGRNTGGFEYVGAGRCAEAMRFGLSCAGSAPHAGAERR